MTGLTPQQAKILGQLLLGCTWAQTAINLNISYNTIKNHRGNIRDRLGVSTSEDMVRCAIDLVPPNERQEWRVRARQLMRIVANVEYGIEYMQAICLGNITETQIAASTGIAKSKVPRVARAVASALGFRTHFTTLAALAYAAYGQSMVQDQPPPPPLKFAPRTRHLLWVWLTENQFKGLEHLVLYGSGWNATAVALGVPLRTLCNRFNRASEILGVGSSIELIMCFIDGLPPKERREWRVRARLLIRLAREVPHGPLLLEVLATEAALQTRTITTAMNRHKLTVSTIQKEVAAAIGIPSRRERLVAVAYAAYGPPVLA